MTLKYANGFETMRDDSDLRNQGWIFSPNTLYTAMYPSGTALPGTAVHPLGAFTSSTTAEGASGANDFAYFNTSITVNQAWNAGGFSFGVAAKFNSATAYSYAAGNNTSNPNQMVYDGSLYWAIRLQGSTYSIASSPDLMTWTVAPDVPAAPSATSTLSYISGTLYFCITSGNSLVIYYSTNKAVSWSSQTMTLNINSNSGAPGIVLASGNSSFPHIVSAGYMNPGANISGLSVWVGTVGGTLTAISSAATSVNTTEPVVCRSKLTNGLVICAAGQNSSVAFQTATAANASLNTNAAWATATASMGLPNDIVYNPSSNLWVVATTTGIYTFANVGGTPSAPSGELTVSQRYSGVAITSLFWNGTELIAVGQNGTIITSTDGITWTLQSNRIMPAASGYNWVGAFNDGSRYVLYSNSTTGVLATSPDLLTNYQALYVMDSAEQEMTTAWGALSVLAVTPPSGSTFTIAGRIGLQCSAVSAGNRTITFVAPAIAGTIGTTPVSTSNLWHYYEVKATRVAGTVNAFTVQLYIDNVSVLGPATIQYAPTNDTTSVLLFNLNRSGQFTAYDDMYLTLDDGVANTLQGPLGTINIVVERPDSDVQAQWTKTGGGATNASAVSQAALSSTSAQYVSSNNAGDKDIYATSTTVPAGYMAKAQIVEAYFTKTSTTAPTVNVGIKSGTAEADSQTVTINGANATYVSLISDVNPNGNVPWNNASINSSDFVINHVS